MRYLTVILMTLFLASLNAQTQFHMEVETGVEFDVTSKSFEDLLSTRADAALASSKARDLSKNWNTVTFGDLTDIIKIVDGLDSMQGWHKEGVQADFYTKTEVRFDSLLFEGDHLSLSAGFYSQAGMHSFVSLESLFGYRILEMTPDTWTKRVHDYVKSVGSLHPTSESAIEWGKKLTDIGYPGHVGLTLAAIAEQEGIDFDGLSGALLFDLLANQNTGEGESYQNGANPLKDNKSLILANRIGWQEFGIGYSIPAAEWLTLDVGARYIRGTKYSESYRATQYKKSQSFNDLGGGIDDSFLMQGDVRQSFGLDFGATIEFSDVIASIQGRNLNAPVLEWKGTRVRFDPQVNVSIDWYPFTSQVPLQLSTSLDLLRVESLVLEDYYKQNLEFGLALNPKWENFAFTMGFGLKKNVAESYAPWKFQGHVAVRFYNVELEIGGNSSTQMEYVGVSLPRSFGLHASLSLHLEW